MLNKGKILLIAAIICISTASLFACLVPSSCYIKAESNATKITDGDYAGWFLYQIDVEWSLAKGLSHWDIILKDGCAAPDHLIEFDIPAGYSTSEEHPDNPTALGWTGYFERNEKEYFKNPLIRYEGPFFPPSDEPGPEGYGTFSFYSNIVPEFGTFENVIVAKANGCYEFGDLVGAYPSCNVSTPEPASMSLFALAFLIITKFKKRQPDIRR